MRTCIISYLVILMNKANQSYIRISGSEVKPPGEPGMGPFSPVEDGQPMKLAVFDFDGTCIDGNSPVMLVRYLALHGMLKPSSWIPIIRWGLSYKLRRPQDSLWVRKLVFEPFSGKPVDEVDAFLARFYAAKVAPRFRPKADEALRAHIEAGHKVVCVTATFKPIIKAAMLHHPIQYQVSTTMAVDEEGNYTDVVEGDPVEGEAKLPALIRFADRTFGEGNWEILWAYGDHHSDATMLEAAKHPFAVTPDKPLEKIAKEKGWPILEWS